jgi:molybdenum cofactor biosynthesis enzyme
MCKALSHDIEIRGLRLMAKAGGRRTFKRRGRAAA